MKFETSEIVRAKDYDQVLDILEAELRSMADRVERSGSCICAGRIKEASFAGLNRTNSIFIAKTNGHQVLLTAQMRYRPSLNLWCWLFLLIPTAFGWLVPILLYIYQMRTAQAAIEQLLRRLSQECEFCFSIEDGKR